MHRKAARGGCETVAGQDCKLASRKSPWGAATPTCDHAVMMSGATNCPGGGTDAVGGRTLGKRPYGARDMIGNVAEWLNDWYDKSYYGTSPEADPQDPADAGKKTFRGGAYSYTPSVVRASMRFNFAVANHRSATIGMRCVRNLPK